jgi:glycosyl transferase family 2/tetratricopeptide repeat protein
MSSPVRTAAALIVKNEEFFLPGCLESLQSRVDQIVVVDTGSTDASTDIASNAGAVLLRHEWQQDFSAARNCGLEAVTCDWVLYIDADERLALPDGGVLGDYLDGSAIAATVRFRPKSGYTRYREPRLFRNDPRLRFEGRIHETIVPKLREISARDGLPIVNSRVELDHLGYDGDQSHKHARNLPLLEASVRNDPDRIYYWYHLAETLAAVGRQREALEACAQGLARAERGASEKQRAEASMIVHTQARLQIERGEDPLPSIAKGLACVPDDHGLSFLYAKALIDAERPVEALAIAQRLLAQDPDLLTDELLAFDRRIFRDKGCELAALACLRLGRRDEAGAYFEKAARLAPDIPAYRFKAAALLPPTAAGS